MTNYPGGASSMKDQVSQVSNAAESVKPEYVAPVVRMMNEADVLSMFQVTAAGSTSWWAM